MTRILTSSLLALSLTFSSISAVPARAGNKNFGKFALGAFTLFVLGNAIAQGKAQSPRYGLPSRNIPYPTFQTPPRQDNSHKKQAKKKHDHKKHADKKHGHKNQGHKQQYRKKYRANRDLPSGCFFNISGRHGQRGVFGKRCLNDKMAQVSRLPGACLETVRIRYGKPASVYGATCLREYGYRIAARR